MQTPTHLESGLTFGMLGRTGFQTLLKEFPTSLQFGTTLVHGERGSRGTGTGERGHRRSDGERGHRRGDGEEGAQEERWGRGGTGGVMGERGHRRGDGGEGEQGHRRNDGGGGH